MFSRVFSSLRLSLGVLMALATLCVVGTWSAAAYVESRTVADAQRVFVSKDVVADILPPPLYLVEARLAVSQLAEGTLNMTDGLRKLDGLLKDYRDREAYWKATPAYGLEDTLLGAQAKAADEFWALYETELRAHLQAGNPTAIADALPRAHALYEAQRKGVDTSVVAGQALAAAAKQSMDSTLDAASKVLVGTLAGFLLLLASLFWLVGRRLWGAVGAEPLALAQAAHSIADGDLRQAAPVAKTGSLAAHLESMRVQLRDVLHRVTDAADSVATASGEIASGVNDLAQRTERQAAALEQTRAAAQQMTEGAQASRDHAKDTARQAAQMAQQARQAHEQADASVRAVQDAAAQSKGIADLVGRIQALAFQTRLLSLNAAVEAARAGESGRGFAVVAQEVRTLAQDTADAAKQIERLASSTGIVLTKATDLSAVAGNSMQQLARQVAVFEAEMAGLAAGSEQALLALSETSAALADLDSLTQQNAALVEQAAAASTSLQGQAQALSETVSRFQT